ncbi:hypothetical protein [Pararhizobium sp. A13]|uniref:hypothetical protein n=1 Tax=Pararhizobium sp. A13 TaxID=3133975 RepID=UPI0032DAFFAD
MNVISSPAAPTAAAPLVSIDRTSRAAHILEAVSELLPFLPEFSVATLHIISGLLLPIRRLLLPDFCRVYRLETDGGERIVGRVIAPSALMTLCRNLGVDQTQVITADQAWTSLIDGTSVVALNGDITPRRVRVIDDYLVELTGFTEGMRDWLKASGLFSEMIAWKTRFFVPTTEEGSAILGRLMQRHRLGDVSGRS